LFIFDSIAKHMEKPLADRMAHVDLAQPCVEIGTNSRECRALLAFILRTTVPRGREALLCHACGNGGCSNPKHLYWGTSSENLRDAYAAGTRTPGRQGFASLDRERLMAASSKGGKATRK
jgi:hypothetical protein